MIRFLKGVFVTLSFLTFATFIYTDAGTKLPMERDVAKPSFESIPVKTVPFILQEGEDNEKQFSWQNTPRFE